MPAINGKVLQLTSNWNTKNQRHNFTDFFECETQIDEEIANSPRFKFQEHLES